MIPFNMIEVPESEWIKIQNGNPDKDIIKVFLSERFLVQVRRHFSIIRLCVNKKKYKMENGKPIWADAITWDELQEIKDQCGYQDKWLVEYYPPKSKIVNVANIRHLWVLDEEPEYSLEKPLHNP